MKKSYIKAISYYLPEYVLSNDDLVKAFPEWDVKRIAEKVGIDQRHIAADDETSGDMAEKAAHNLFNAWDVDPEEIDFVILVTQSPDHFLPTTACILQDRLNIPTTAGALDINLGCSGYVYGLAVAKGLIVGETAKNVLLLTAETYTKYIDHNDKGNRTIFGDAASATVISDNGFSEIGAFSLGSDGSGAENLIVQTGGMRQRTFLGESVTDSGVQKHSPNHLYMNGPEIFIFTQTNVPIVVRETLQKNNLEHDDIDLFVFHQANKHILDLLRKRIKIEEDKFYHYMAKVGNTVSSTIPIALSEAMKEERIFSGNNVLISGFGVGYSWGGCVLKF